MLASFGFLSLRSQDPGRYNYQMTNRSGAQPPAADRRLRVVCMCFMFTGQPPRHLSSLVVKVHK